MRVFSLILSTLLVLAGSMAIADEGVVHTTTNGAESTEEKKDVTPNPEEKKSETKISIDDDESTYERAVAKAKKLGKDVTGVAVANPKTSIGVGIGVSTLMVSLIAKCKGVGFYDQLATIAKPFTWPFRQRAVGQFNLQPLNIQRNNLPNVVELNAENTFETITNVNKQLQGLQDIVGQHDQALQNVGNRVDQLATHVNNVAQQSAGGFVRNRLGNIWGLTKLLIGVKAANVAHQMVCDRLGNPWLCNDKQLADSANKKVDTYIEQGKKLMQKAPKKDQ